MHANHKKLLVLLIGITAFSLLACSIVSKNSVATPTIPVVMPPDVAPNPTAAARAENNFNQAMQEAKGGRDVQFHLTPEELTSLVVQVLKERADIPIANPVIWFYEGNIYMQGDVQSFGTTQIVLQPFVTDAHQLQVKLVEAKIGVFSIPEAITGNITETANQSLQDMPFNIRVSAVDVRADEIVITFSRTD